MTHSLAKGLSLLARRGPVSFVRHARTRLYNWHYERKFGVDTGGWFEPAELGFTNPDSKPYGPGSWDHILWSLGRVPFPDREVEFIDFGSGRGRAVVAAAARPYRRVTGVELSGALVADARRNIALMGSYRKAPVDFWEGDAAQFPIPPTANVFYFCNPFQGETLARMVAGLRESFAAHPRPGFIIYFNPRYFHPMVAGETWLQHVHHSLHYPDMECRLYRIG